MPHRFIPKRAIALLAMLALAGVGARAADGPASPVRIACIGDSITFGLGIMDPGDRYPAQLQILLGPGYVVKNFGHPGCTVTRDSFSGWPRGYAKQAEYAGALEFQPDIVICNLGINDVSDFAVPQHPAFVRDYLEIIAAFRSRSGTPRFILWQPLAPLFPGHRYYQAPAVGQLNELIAQVAVQAGAETLDMHAPLAGHAEWVSSDHIHPNAQGARRIAEVTRDYLCAQPAR